MKVQVDSSVLFINLSPQGSAVEDFGQAAVAWIGTLNFFLQYFLKIKDFYCAVNKIGVSRKLVSFAIWGKKS